MEYVSNGVDGFLVDFPTAACFSQAMEAAWAHRGEWKEMGRAAHRKISHLVSKVPPSEELLRILENHE
jgi:hypothetical protein